jgi:hypothetical protein
VWNTRDIRVPWLARINALMESLAGDAPRFRSSDQRWRGVVEAHPAFGPLATAAFDNPVAGVDVATMRARVASTSYVSALPNDEREAVLAEVEAIVADQGAVFTEHYRTEVFWCRRR